METCNAVKRNGKVCKNKCKYGKYCGVHGNKDGTIKKDVMTIDTINTNYQVKQLTFEQIKICKVCKRIINELKKESFEECKDKIDVITCSYPAKLNHNKMISGILKEKVIIDLFKTTTIKVVECDSTKMFSDCIITIDEKQYDVSIKTIVNINDIVLKNHHSKTQTIEDNYTHGIVCIYTRMSNTLMLFPLFLLSEIFFRRAKDSFVLKRYVYSFIINNYKDMCYAGDILQKYTNNINEISVQDLYEFTFSRLQIARN